jgi:hypothetical protein
MFGMSGGAYPMRYGGWFETSAPESVDRIVSVAKMVALRQAGKKPREKCAIVVSAGQLAIEGKESTASLLTVALTSIYAVVISRKKRVAVIASVVAGGNVAYDVIHARTKTEAAGITSTMKAIFDQLRHDMRITTRHDELSVEEGRDRSDQGVTSSAEGYMDVCAFGSEGYMDVCAFGSEGYMDVCASSGEDLCALARDFKR